MKATGWVVLAFMLVAVRMFACECAPPPPACQAVGQSGLVFIGTVTQLDAKPNSFKTAKMHIDRVFKGKLSETEELFDDGMCDGPTLEVGHQYLMYTTRFGTGAIPSRGCTRSRPIEFAQEDLAFLKQYATGNVTTHVSGMVRFRTDQPNDSEGGTPLKGAHVIIAGNRKQFAATTDSLGAYSITTIPPGNYDVDVKLAGYSVNRLPKTISVPPNGCAVVDALMKVDRRIQGVVRDVRGVPAAGVLVEMIATKPGSERWREPTLLSVSGEDGSYAIDGIPPGEYYLGVNVRSTPIKENPYPRSYYPGVSDAKDAVKIHVGQGAATHSYDLRVPGKLPLIEIQGRIVMQDGKPPSPDKLAQVRFMEPGLYGQVGRETIEVDAEGRFRFVLCEGIAYSAFAFAAAPADDLYSSPLEFVANLANQRLEFVLNKSWDEFQKLSEK